MPIDPYAALNAMVRAEVARSSEPPVAAPPGRPESQQSDAGGEAVGSGRVRGGRRGEEDPASA
ncbi:hypothetical protein [Streptomyces sp. NPDC055287]